MLKEPEDQDDELPTPHEYWDLLGIEDQWEIMLKYLCYFDAEFTVSIKLTFNKLAMWQQPWGTYPKTNKEKFVIEAVKFDI